MVPLIPKTMHAIELIAHGGFDKLVYNDNKAVPEPTDNQVLINVTAAGINNTDINTRIGWYSKSVNQDTNSGGDGFADVNNDDASWSGAPLSFPRVQGADICGYIVAVGKNVDKNRIGERVMVRSMQHAPDNDKPYICWTIGSECDGGFAQFAVAFDKETYKIACDWRDEELATIPCAYSTAENMLHRANVKNERIFITGASGGVGSAAIQLAKRRGATIIAQASKTKAQQIKALGVDMVIDRHDDILEMIDRDSIDVVVDLVAGQQWGSYLEILRRGGRYVTAGAIAGPIVDLDVRTLYLKDLTLIGATYQEDVVFANLVSYIEKGEIKPLLSKAYPLQDIVTAQQDFLDKKYIGKLVLIPPAIA